MKTKKFWIIISSVVLLLLYLTQLPLPHSDTETLVYERTIDGDTFVASGRRIRLWGIDAPEKDHPSGYAATLLLQGFLTSGELSCKLVDVDRYDRDVMHCLVDGSDIGSMMVHAGMSTDYKRYSDGYYDVEEKYAKSKGVGIWKNNVSGRL